jgi:Protein of unknown function (DUF1208).
MLLFTFRLRDKSDEVVKAIKDYAEAENVNRSLRNGLLQFSCTLSAIGDYRYFFIPTDRHS